MHLIAAFAVTLLAQEDLSRLHAFGAGTKWIYRAYEKNPAGALRSESTITEAKADRVVMETAHYDGPKVVAKKTQTWTTKNGMLLLDAVPVYMSGSRKGDSWTYRLGDADFKASNLGVEELKVPAGTYKDAIHIQHTSTGATIHQWLVPGVGVIKTESAFGDKPTFTLELREFTPAK